MKELYYKPNDYIGHRFFSFVNYLLLHVQLCSPGISVSFILLKKFWVNIYGESRMFLYCT